MSVAFVNIRKLLPEDDAVPEVGTTVPISEKAVPCAVERQAHSAAVSSNSVHPAEVFLLPLFLVVIITISITCLFRSGEITNEPFSRVFSTLTFFRTAACPCFSPLWRAIPITIPENTQSNAANSTPPSQHRYDRVAKGGEGLGEGGRSGGGVGTGRAGGLARGWRGIANRERGGWKMREFQSGDRAFGDPISVHLFIFYFFWTFEFYLQSSIKHQQQQITRPRGHVF